jgi:tetratricopeptide (TPR) repeat protein
MSKQTYFVSYTNRTPKDIAWAKWACWILENKVNAETIMQEYDFRVGDNFKILMHEALQRADAVVCILTRTYLESANCAEEWTNADRIIPVRFDDCVPPGLLTSRIYIDLYGLDKASARERLISQLLGSKRPADEPDAPFATAANKTPEIEPEFPESSVVTHNLPGRNRYFTGRDDILAKIHTGFLSSQIVSVKGAGGYGKTEIAVEYAYIHVAEYTLICYFNACSENQLLEDYREFARSNCGVNNAAELDFDSIRRIVNDWFSANSSYLLIYDNAEGMPDLRNYLPLGSGKRHVLINSREALKQIVSERLEVAKFSTTDAVDFIRLRVNNVSESYAKELADALDNLPLALECAVAYIEESGCSLTEYLSLFKRHSLRVLDHAVVTADYHKTIQTVWNATFERISTEAETDPQTKAALQLFKLCTYCASENIPLSLFVKARVKTPEPLRSALDPADVPTHIEMINKLTSYSLVSRQRVDGDTLITVHRLMQTAANYNFERNKEWVDCCLTIAESVLNYTYGTREEFDEFATNLPHIAEIARHVETHLTDDDSRERTAYIYAEIGTGLYNQGDYVKALEWYYKALAIREKVLGAEHPSTATTYNNIAVVYFDEGKFSEARDLFCRAFIVFIICELAEHPNAKSLMDATHLSYGKAGGSEKDFDVWLQERMATYPAWCQ